MGIESATYLHQLDAANPAGSDPLADADNHLRLLKAVLKATFPNLKGPVSRSNTELDGVVPVGGVIMWSGAKTAIPSGWVLCDGTTVQRSDGTGTIKAPNLIDKFVVAAGGTYDTGATGGSTTGTGTTSGAGGHYHNARTDAQGSHSHGGNTAGSGLSVENLPPHAHNLGFALNGFAGVPIGGPVNCPQITGSNQPTAATGSGTAHAHGIGADGLHSHNVEVDPVGDHAHTVSVSVTPPYFALCYIMKI